MANTKMAMQIVQNMSELLTNNSQCKDGLILPAWEPQENITRGDTVGRALVYAFSLAYMFLGVSIISDRFMAAIEVITSQEREIRVHDQNGVEQVVMVRYWNETVSNLTVRKKRTKTFFFQKQKIISQLSSTRQTFLYIT
jgi:hypothetical protein